MGRRGSWEAAPPPPPVAALKRGAVLHGQLGLSLLFGFPIIRSTWYSNVFYVEYLFLVTNERSRTDAIYCISTLMYMTYAQQHYVTYIFRPNPQKLSIANQGTAYAPRRIVLF